LCLREADVLASTDWQNTTQWKNWFLLFDKAIGSLSLKEFVVSTGPLCSVEREASWCQQNSKVWSLLFTCVCDSGLLVLSRKLWVPMGSNADRLQSSDAYNIVKAMGSTCVGAWAFMSHRSHFKHGGTKPLVSRSIRACLF
jgi:hypothetical protein